MKNDYCTCENKHLVTRWSKKDNEWVSTNKNKNECGDCGKEVELLDEKFILSKGWVKSTWFGMMTGYIHKNFNYVNDNFFIEMKIYRESDNNYVKIFEDCGLDTTQIFQGYLHTNEDLETIMRLLEFDFN